jgi:3-methylfumaryl-CoA hydratase
MNDVVTANAVRALHDLLDREGDAPGEGDPVPPLWHWLAFLPQARQSELGPDGHPRGRPGRRMFAGGRLEFQGVLRVGEALVRQSTVTDVTTKQGRSGELTFVRVEHRVFGESGGVHETNDIVYRRAERWVEGTAPEDAWAPARSLEITSTLLFRFSALTYNAHRIHYDREYATTVEGYPGLVVHGPLQAVLLADLLGDLRTFTFRSTAPAFAGDRLSLSVRDSELAAHSAGRMTMHAVAELA